MSSKYSTSFARNQLLRSSWFLANQLDVRTVEQQQSSKKSLFLPFQGCCRRETKQLQHLQRHNPSHRAVQEGKGDQGPKQQTKNKT